jgi:hypothetical protein
VCIFPCAFHPRSDTHVYKCVPTHYIFFSIRYVLGETAAFVPDPSSVAMGAMGMAPTHGRLSISGYLRGTKALTANHLVCVSGAACLLCVASSGNFKV